MALIDRASRAGTAGRRQCHDGLMPRVLVVSSARLLREAFAVLLEHEQGVAIVGTAGPPQAPVLAAELRPDIVLLDATRGGNLGCARELAEQHPTGKIVVFGVAETDADIVSLASAGVAGYVSEDAAAKDMLAVVKSAMRDELLCSPRAAATLCHQVAVLSRGGAEAGLNDTHPLSKRELQIADLIDRGLSNKDIARYLGIEVATVKNHVHNILDKLKVRRRGEAAACLRATLARPRPHDAGAPSD
jgi:two-component system nitrate/nitrite response regulator NarL